MSKISLKSSSSGTATFTIESPSTNTDRTLNLPDGSGALYNQSNIVGTVSQSGGVPTGAIIERGSNANGEFVKYADGTLICTSNLQLVSMGSGNNLNAAGGTAAIFYTFAAPFAADPVVNLTTRVGTSSAAIAADINAGFRSSNNLTEAEVKLKAISGSGTTQSVIVHLTAIGRWF